MKEHIEVYRHTGSYAQAHGELERYRASLKANIACRDAIDKAISAQYKDGRLNTKEAVKQVADEFGFDRILYVLANTVQHKDWDGRISRDNKEWAKTVPVARTEGNVTDTTLHFVVDRTHPGLLDLFVDQAKEDYLLAKSAKVSMETQGFSVPSHIGTWHTIDRCEIDGHSFFLMEHDTFGDEAACIVVDQNGGLVIDFVYEGLDDYAMYLLKQEVAPVPIMPDNSISVQEMKDYGYPWGGMLPLHEDEAQKLAASLDIFLLYADGTERIAESEEDIRDHAAKGGIFSVEKEVWVKHLEKELTDKAINTAASQNRGEAVRKPAQEKTADKDGKPSILDRLKASKAEKPNETSTPQHGPKDNRDR